MKEMARSARRRDACLAQMLTMPFCITLWSCFLVLDASQGHLVADGELSLASLANVVIDSGFTHSPSVFSSGQPTSMWALRNPGVSLAPEDNVAVFTVRSGEGEADTMTQRALSLLAPDVQVSQNKVLDVIITKEVQSGPAPLILIARHVCKQSGSAQVTITLPQHASATPLAFSYRKACKPRASGLSLMRVQTSRWDVPTYGWRFCLAAFLIILVGICGHEFGHHYLSNKLLKQIKEKLGPEVFGTELEVGSLSVRPWSGIFVLKDFKIKNPPGFSQDKYLLSADEVSLLLAPKRVIYTLGRNFDILLLRLDRIHVEVEFSTFLQGPNNIAVLQKHMSDSQQKWADEEASLERQGKKPGFFAKFMDHKFHDLLEHAQLHKAEFLDIMVSSHSMLGSAELTISDMHFEDFSKENNATGLRSILSRLGDVFYHTIKQDTLGETGAKVVSAAEKAGYDSRPGSEASSPQASYNLPRESV